MTIPEPTEPETVSYRSVVLQLGALCAALAVVGAVLGYLAKGGPGVWGALMGAIVIGVFFGTTAVVMHLGKHGGPQVQIRNLVISWFIKLVVMFAAFVALNQASWLEQRVFGLTVLVGVFGSLAIEGRAVWSARIGLDTRGQF